MVKSFRNWNKVDIEAFCDELHLEDLDYTLSNLDDFLQAYQRQLVDVTNEKVPMKKMKIISQDSQPWYNDELKEQMWKLKWREKIWRKYSEKHQWTAYNDE